MTTPPDISGRQPPIPPASEPAQELTGAAAGGAPQPDDVRSGRGQRARRVLPLLGSLQGYIGLVLIVGIGIWTQGGRFANVDNITNAIWVFDS